MMLANKSDKFTEKKETIQDIANKLVDEQMRLREMEHGPRERTVFLLGSKGVGKSSVINRFFDREENLRPTLALEYSFGRRSNPSHSIEKQIMNVWELGSLENSEQLIKVPMRSHGLDNFAAIIMLDLSQPNRVWLDLESAYKGLKKTCVELIDEHKQALYQERAVERVKKQHVDLPTLELMPFPIVIVGGKYDVFMDFDPELKKRLCRCLRSMAHLIGASLLFYSKNIPKLAKTVRDTISHLGFGSPSHPFRTFITDYNEALSIWFGSDSWERIGIDSVGGNINVDMIGSTLDRDIPQVKVSSSGSQKTQAMDPAKDPGFQESIIDEMRAQKDEELKAIMRESQMRGKFETITG